MGKYTDLKNIFKEKKQQLQDEIEQDELTFLKGRKLDKISDSLRVREELLRHDTIKALRIALSSSLKIGGNKPYYDKILELRSFFPELENVFDVIRDINNYDFLITKNGIESININEFLNELARCNGILGVPKKELVEFFATVAKEYLKTNRRGDNPRLRAIDMTIKVVLNDICVQITNGALDFIKRIYETAKLNAPVIDKKRNKKIIDLINRFDRMITEDDVIVVFNDDEADDYHRLINAIITDPIENHKYSTSVIEDSFKEKLPPVDLGELVLSGLTEEERSIVEEFREIVEDEDFNNIAVAIEPMINARIPNWSSKFGIESILSFTDVGLYGNSKNELIDAYKIIIEVYKEYLVKLSREERVDKLNRFVAKFIGILRNIDKTSHQESEIHDYIEEITSYYLPYANELVDTKEIDDSLDAELEEKIEYYNSVIKECKKEIMAYYNSQTGEEKESVEENTDNLVFCCTDNGDEYNEGELKELVGTIHNLESKTSHELKCPGGRKGMTRMRKTTKKGTEVDFVQWFEQTLKKKIHFVPYRFSSTADYRTALIKINPSQVVKKHLEERYALSPQCAIYAPILVIEAVGANHNEYSFIESLLARMGGSLFEELALMFADEDPDFEKLDSKVDEMLEKKRKIFETAAKKDVTTK